MTKTFYVYMMANRSRVVLYTGITNSLVRRVWEHQNGDIEGFTKKYRVNRLVYYENFDDPRHAISREKEIKGWRKRQEKCAGGNEESEVGGFISDAFSAYEGSLASLGITAREGVSC